MSDLKNRPSDTTAGHGGFRLTILAGTGVGTTFEAKLGATITIGRARDNAFVLRDPVVSRHHAIIEPTASGYCVRDTGSLAGVIRRAQRIPDEGAALTDGDELELGPIVLRFTLHPVPAAPAAPTRAPTFPASPPAPPRRDPAEPRPSPPLPARPKARPEGPPPVGENEAASQRTASATSPSPIGSFGSYQILRSLGSQNRNTLDLAVDSKTGTEVDLQRITLSDFGWLARRRLAREFIQLVEIEHPNLSAATDAGRLGNVAYRVYPHIPGARVEELLRDCRRHLTIALATFVGREVCHALIHIEETLGQHYRVEVTASNVVVARSGSVILQRVGAPAAPVERSPRNGTSYLAPEESATRGGDHRSTIFALGILLYELLSREQVDASQKLALRSIDTVRIDVPATLADIVMKAVEVRPDDRFASASAMEQALTRELDDMTLRMDGPGLKRWMAERYP